MLFFDSLFSNEFRVWTVTTAALLVLFSVTAHAGKLKTLYSFTGGADGSGPVGTLVKDKLGNLYGTAFAGGNQQGNCAYNTNYGTGCGTVFELTKSGSGWTYNVIYGFKGYPDDGANPDNEALAIDKEGNLYGTTMMGGSFDCFLGAPGCGTVFKLSSSENGWSETVLYNFTGQVGDGYWPFSGVILDKKGNLYGTLFHSAIGPGLVYAVTSAGSEHTIYSFTGGADGGEPFGSLTLDKPGNLYGTTQYGGSIQDCDGVGCGVVFKLAADGRESVLHTFAGGDDGEWPWAGLTFDTAGNLYGTTWVGGGSGCGGNGCGTVFELAPDGTETVLHRFVGADGSGPWARVILTPKGTLYGTTAFGGNGCGVGCGTVFALAPDGTETVLHDFSQTDGVDIVGGLVQESLLFGLSSAGGAYGHGAIFSLSPTIKK